MILGMYTDYHAKYTSTSFDTVGAAPYSEYLGMFRKQHEIIKDHIENYKGVLPHDKAYIILGHKDYKHWIIDFARNDVSHLMKKKDQMKKMGLTKFGGKELDVSHRLMPISDILRLYGYRKSKVLKSYMNRIGIPFEVELENTEGLCIVIYLNNKPTAMYKVDIEDMDFIRSTLDEINEVFEPRGEKLTSKIVMRDFAAILKDFDASVIGELLGISHRRIVYQHLADRDILLKGRINNGKGYYCRIPQPDKVLINNAISRPLGSLDLWLWLEEKEEGF